VYKRQDNYSETDLGETKSKVNRKKASLDLASKLTASGGIKLFNYADRSELSQSSMFGRSRNDIVEGLKEGTYELRAQLPAGSPLTMDSNGNYIPDMSLAYMIVNTTKDGEVYFVENMPTEDNKNFKTAVQGVESYFVDIPIGGSKEAFYKDKYGNMQKTTVTRTHKRDNGNTGLIMKRGMYGQKKDYYVNDITQLIPSE